MKNNKSRLLRAYRKSKAATVGEIAICPSCGTSFIKTNYQQAFCKSRPYTECKDFYWNNVTPSKRNNTTRISPASSAWIEKHSNDPNKVDYENDHPFSSEALGQS